MKKGVLTDFTEFAGVFMWILKIAEHLRTTASVMPSKWFLPTKIDETFKYEILFVEKLRQLGQEANQNDGVCRIQGNISYPFW